MTPEELAFLKGITGTWGREGNDDLKKVGRLVKELIKASLAPYPEDLPPISSIVFDFDGILAKPVWPDRDIGEPIDEGFSLLRYYARAGYRIEIHSSRREIDSGLIWDWVEKHDLPVDAVICGDKPLAALYVDDRSYRPAWVENYPYPPQDASGE